MIIKERTVEEAFEKEIRSYKIYKLDDYDVMAEREYLFTKYGETFDSTAENRDDKLKLYAMLVEYFDDEICYRRLREDDAASEDNGRIIDNATLHDAFIQGVLSQGINDMLYNPVKWSGDEFINE